MLARYYTCGAFFVAAILISRSRNLCNQTIVLEPHESAKKFMYGTSNLTISSRANIAFTPHYNHFLLQMMAVTTLLSFCALQVRNIQLTLQDHLWPEHSLKLLLTSQAVTEKYE